MSRVKLVATEGMIYTNGESCGKVVFLGIGDNPENWHEITKTQAENMMEQEVCLYEADLY